MAIRDFLPIRESSITRLNTNNHRVDYTSANVSSLGENSGRNPRRPTALIITTAGVGVGVRNISIRPTVTETLVFGISTTVTFMMSTEKTTKPALPSQAEHILGEAWARPMTISMAAECS